MPRRKYADRSLRRALRVVCWNMLLLAAGVAVAAIALEAYFRLTTSFPVSSIPREFVPGMGLRLPPDAEVRHTNGLEFWAVSRTNSLGFLDREPPSPERAAATCHVTMIGDSFVAAMEVPIRDKFHVRLEELAASRLPHLDVTTSAFGIVNTGQVQQLPMYDEYARKLRPKLLVLVLVPNDFLDNSPVLQSIVNGWDPEHLPYASVKKHPDGTMELRPPDPGYDDLRLPVLPGGWESLVDRVTAISWFGSWLRAKKRNWYRIWRPPSLRPGFVALKFARRVETLSQRPRYAPLLEGWPPVMDWNMMLQNFGRGSAGPPVFEDALDYTAFALEQFEERADRDGVRLVILASHFVKKADAARIGSVLDEMAATLDIPVIDQGDYILRQGARLTDAQWPHDGHWNPAGHQWAAEALLEYIDGHQAVCDGPASAVVREDSDDPRQGRTP